MSVYPGTNIELLVCPLTADQENQITFATVEEQTAYFNSLPANSSLEATYQRKDGYIRYPVPADALQKFNYVRYQNTQWQSNKWFYAFIERIEYVNEYVSNIYIKTDVFQTWMFEHLIEPSFIEREHVANDGIGLHTMPEGLELGDYIVHEYIPLNWASVENSLICMQVTDFPSSANVTTAPITVYNAMPSGCYYLVFNRANLEDINRWINAYVDKPDAILAIFPIPNLLANPLSEQSSQIAKLQNSLSSNTYIFTQTSEPVQMATINIDYPGGDDFGGYTPKNNKLYTAPYCYFYLNTFTGSTVEYHYEQFYGPIQFTVYGSITAGGEYKLVPSNIIGAGAGSYGYGMSLSSMPQGSWNNDTYQNWRALNMDAISIEAERDAITSLISAGQNAANFNLLGIAQGEIDYQYRVKQRVNQERVASKMPNQARGDTACQSLNWSMGNAHGGIYRMCIKAEYAKVIDEYFSAFGYRVNEFKIPNTNSRQYYNYIKTVGVNIRGTFPQDDIIALKQIYDRGVTLWHDPDNFLNYNVDNVII